MHKNCACFANSSFNNLGTIPLYFIRPCLCKTSKWLKNVHKSGFVGTKATPWPIAIGQAHWETCQIMPPMYTHGTLQLILSRTWSINSRITSSTIKLSLWWVLHCSAAQVPLHNQNKQPHRAPHCNRNCSWKKANFWWTKVTFVVHKSNALASSRGWAQGYGCWVGWQGHRGCPRAGAGGPNAY